MENVTHLQKNTSQSWIYIYQVTSPETISGHFGLMFLRAPYKFQFYFTLLIYIYIYMYIYIYIYIHIYIYFLSFPHNPFLPLSQLGTSDSFSTLTYLFPNIFPPFLASAITTSVTSVASATIASSFVYSHLDYFNSLPRTSFHAN